MHRRQNLFSHESSDPENCEIGHSKVVVLEQTNSDSPVEYGLDSKCLKPRNDPTSSLIKGQIW